MKLSVLITAVAAALAVPTSAHSGEQAGRITELLVRASDGLIYFFLEGTHSDRPQCASNTYWVIKAETTTAGKQQYAALLAAKMSGRAVRVDGANQCTRWADGEDVDSVRLID